MLTKSIVQKYSDYKIGLETTVEKKKGHIVITKS